MRIIVSNNRQNQGLIYVIATPIGNLADISARALQILSEVNLIAAEDTRHSKRLLEHFNIHTPQIALHEHNEKEITQRLITRILHGESIALISDAGTPLISDPGYPLIAKARAVGIKIVPIPGPCAAIAALSVAGLPSDRFIFEGFLPAQTKQRINRLKELLAETRTMIFYEAPHRILSTLLDMQAVFGKERYVVIARELTKLYETIYGDSLEKLILFLEHDPNQQRGELVILVKGAEKIQSNAIDPHVLEILGHLLEKLSLKEAAALTAKITGVSKNELYRAGLKTSENKSI